ncbi:MAG: hypothetical protein ACREBV_09860, partial [Candidatus Zixiibacteriota bacterium]
MKPLSSSKLQILIAIGVCIIVESSSSARDKRASKSEIAPDTKSLTSNNSLTPQQINWPSFYGVHNTGEIKAVFDCFGNFGNNTGLIPLNDSSL